MYYDIFFFNWFFLSIARKIGDAWEMGDEKGPGGIMGFPKILEVTRLGCRNWEYKTWYSREEFHCQSESLSSVSFQAT